LIDPGIAGPMGTGRSVTAWGTVPYVAPEKLRGELEGSASDLYSLACLLYEAIQGAPPFGTTPEQQVVQAHLAKSPPRLEKGISEGLVELISRCLAKNPQERPESAEHAYRLIEPWVNELTRARIITAFYDPWMEVDSRSSQLDVHSQGGGAVERRTTPPPLPAKSRSSVTPQSMNGPTINGPKSLAAPQSSSPPPLPAKSKSSTPPPLTKSRSTAPPGSSLSVPTKPKSLTPPPLAKSRSTVPPVPGSSTPEMPVSEPEKESSLIAEAAPSYEDLTSYQDLKGSTKSDLESSGATTHITPPIETQSLPLEAQSLSLEGPVRARSELDQPTPSSSASDDHPTSRDRKVSAPVLTKDRSEHAGEPKNLDDREHLDARVGDDSTGLDNLSEPASEDIQLLQSDSFDPAGIDDSLILDEPTVVTPVPRNMHTAEPVKAGPSATTPASGTERDTSSASPASEHASISEPQDSRSSRPSQRLSSSEPGEDKLTTALPVLVEPEIASAHTSAERVSSTQASSVSLNTQTPSPSVTQAREGASTPKAGTKKTDSARVRTKYVPQSAFLMVAALALIGPILGAAIVYFAMRQPGRNRLRIDPEVFAAATREVPLKRRSSLDSTKLSGSLAPVGSQEMNARETTRAAAPKTESAAAVQNGKETERLESVATTAPAGRGARNVAQVESDPEQRMRALRTHRKALVAFRSGRYSNAAVLYQQLTELDPSFAGGFMGLGACYLQRGKAEQAVEAYAQAVALQPQNADYHVAHGRALQFDGRPREARESFSKALNANPDHRAAKMALGRR
ncbi:MAG: tetratricopeptide repeat protein, partial [Myxococcota bacterium]